MARRQKPHNHPTNSNQSRVCHRSDVLLEMTRSLYLWLFMVLAVLFVPIIINFGVVVWIVPDAWGIASLVKEIFRAKFRPAFGFGVYSAIYLGLFYLAARLTYWLTSRVSRQPLRLSVQCLLLASLFCCSFLRVLTYGSIQGRGGTYNFWTAVERHFERQRSQ